MSGPGTHHAIAGHLNPTFPAEEIGRSGLVPLHLARTFISTHTAINSRLEKSKYKADQETASSPNRVILIANKDRSQE